MIDAVIVFGLINVVFEFVVLSMLVPRWRLRLLGNRAAQTSLHLTIGILILIVHWGTLVGTMSGFFSFILSIGTVALARGLYGHITENRYYTRGLLSYSAAELL